MLRVTVQRLAAPRQVTVHDVQAAFRVMQLKPGASADDVRKKYLEMARRNHPDVNGGDDSKMKAVNIAYEVVQGHGHLLTADQQEARTAKNNKGGKAATSSGGDGATSEPNRYKREWKRGARSPAADNSGWTSRSEFDWAAAVGVTPDERLDGRNHPNTFNPFFSFDDDATLYQQVRAGSSVAEAARTLGKPTAQIEKRLNSPQFKMRVQGMLKSNHSGARAAFRNTANPRRTVVRQQPPPQQGPGAPADPSATLHFRNEMDGAGGAARGDSFGGLGEATNVAVTPNPRKLVSKMGRSYANLARFTKQHRNRS